MDVPDCPYEKIGGRKNALWRTMIADFAGERKSPEGDWLLLETWYDRVGWQQDLPDLTSKTINETAVLTTGIKDMEVQMVAHYANLRATTTEYTDFVTNASVATIIKDSFTKGFQLPKKYGEYVRRIRKACARRALYVTSKGYIGLAPWNAREGDLVCIFKGGKTPFLLRLPPAGSVYQLVGETYVHGIMGGEAVAADASDNDWRVFNLR
ncbi:hypothetical protein GLAREA_00980 [Glarea lozoyensis ATCC 20868]|uniref:Heterokaryon incompatibility protein 6, OR allele n=1 Tax=Glarea lozoyensis (strain ATCC 20868 / MF5171) TaxID=1116229 RepID=S3CW31_GLAL2|nr:uncharacterized protein GLAREA_00980 [Glarea lozoyensis ATCC 20868]EPE29820.1 hypothetical protein GLAREA_00980 [Glarea lozoyensis ATCC 20868]